MWYNSIISIILRSPLHGLLSSGIMLVTYIGRKSGRKWSLPVSFTADEATVWTVSLRKRTWWRNLRDEAQVTLRLKGKVRLAICQVYETEAEVRAALETLFALAPEYARFLEVKLDEEGKPLEEDLLKVIPRRVVVRFTLLE